MVAALTGGCMDGATTKCGLGGKKAPPAPLPPTGERISLGATVATAAGTSRSGVIAAAAAAVDAGVKMDGLTEETTVAAEAATGELLWWWEGGGVASFASSPPRSR